MIAAGPDRSGGQKEAHIQGWLVSVLLHGTVALAAILLVKQDPTLAAGRSVQVERRHGVADAACSINGIGPEPDSGPTSSIDDLGSPSSPQQTVPAQTLPSPQPLAQQTTPSIPDRTAAPVVTEPPAPPQRNHDPSQSAAHTTQPAEPVRHEAAAPMVAESTSIVKPAEAPMAVSAESDTQTAPSSAPSAILEQTSQSDQAPDPDGSHLPGTIERADEARLRVALRRDFTSCGRIETLPRLSAGRSSRRKSRGKSRDQRGRELGEVEIFQSSGHPALDKAAVETMRQAAPFHLPHPLGQPRMTIKIPMSYRLDR